MCEGPSCVGTYGTLAIAHTSAADAAAIAQSHSQRSCRADKPR
jgi:hypothetical protein